MEKGIFSTPNPKMGKAFEDDTVALVRSIYCQDDISRTMQINPTTDTGHTYKLSRSDTQKASVALTKRHKKTNFVR